MSTSADLSAWALNEGDDVDDARATTGRMRSRNFDGVSASGFLDSSRGVVAGPPRRNLAPTHSRVAERAS